MFLRFCVLCSFMSFVFLLICVLCYLCYESKSEMKSNWNWISQGFNFHFNYRIMTQKHLLQGHDDHKMISMHSSIISLWKQMHFVHQRCFTFRQNIFVQQTQQTQTPTLSLWQVNDNVSQYRPAPNIMIESIMAQMKYRRVKDMRV